MTALASIEINGATLHYDAGSRAQACALDSGA
jgi:hypothetical protein